MIINNFKKRVAYFVEFLNVTPDAFVLGKDVQESDFFFQAISLFKDNHQIFLNYLFKIFDLKLRHALMENYNEKGFPSNEKIEQIIKASRVGTLEKETGLFFPRPILSKSSLIIQLFMLLGPAAMFIIFLMLRTEFFIVILGIVKIGIIFFLLTVPYTICYFLIPKVFQPSEFVRVETYHEFVNELVSINMPFYMDNDYALSLKEVRAFFDAGSEHEC